MNRVSDDYDRQFSRKMQSKTKMSHTDRGAAGSSGRASRSSSDYKRRKNMASN